MLEIDRSYFGLRTKMIWLSDEPFDVDGVDAVNFISCMNAVDLEGFHREDLHTIVIDLSQGIDTVWRNISTKCRSNIRRADRDGCEVSVGRDLPDFPQLNGNMRSKKGLAASGPPMELLAHIDSLPSDNVALFTAGMCGQMLGGVLFLIDDDRMLALLSASRRLDVGDKERSLIANANRLIWWEAICFGAERGIRRLDMGGYYLGDMPNPQLEGVNEFKRRFGGVVVNDYSYHKVYSTKMKIARSLAQPFCHLRQKMSTQTY